MTKLGQIKRTFMVLVGASLLILAGCNTTDFRDALQGGVFDFISGTVTNTLTALLPIADTLGT